MLVGRSNGAQPYLIFPRTVSALVEETLRNDLMYHPVLSVEDTMKTLLHRALAHLNAWFSKPNLDRDTERNDAHFREHLVTFDKDDPSWMKARPDNPGPKSARFNHVFDVAAPKTV